ncbi:hypothetical protein LZD49_12550 [Dyadobacter sp. CY261]|uniref:hypothetical protein n=1 Tax=Dyadobacter sp. CY261 TaxID=2907203 RepID=UPI001F198A5C|nr:hypothetical protein [Dyadobacter sp. CY261]MCF0071303.1 hypothetical protein [Dyadobacter sp. CY261]
MTTSEHVKYNIDGDTIFEIRQPVMKSWLLFQVIVPGSGRPQVKPSFAADSVHADTEPSSEEEYMDAYFLAVHGAMKGEFIAD